jgi:hypothetical protein
MKIAMAGALSGPFQVLPGRDNLCGNRLADDQRSVNYVLWGHVAGAGDDIGVAVNFAVHRYSTPGTFAVGAYPAGTATSPGIGSVVREISVRDMKTWISGSGSLVIDAGAKSGTLDLRLSSPAGLGELTVSGTWVCPEGSLT